MPSFALQGVVVFVTGCSTVEVVVPNASFGLQGVVVFVTGSQPATSSTERLWGEAACI